MARDEDNGERVFIGELEMWVGAEELCECGAGGTDDYAGGAEIRVGAPFAAAVPGLLGEIELRVAVQSGTAVDGDGQVKLMQAESAPLKGGEDGRGGVVLLREVDCVRGHAFGEYEFEIGVGAVHDAQTERHREDSDDCNEWKGEAWDAVRSAGVSGNKSGGKDGDGGDGEHPEVSLRAEGEKGAEGEEADFKKRKVSAAREGRGCAEGEEEQKEFRERAKGDGSELADLAHCSGLSGEIVSGFVDGDAVGINAGRGNASDESDGQRAGFELGAGACSCDALSNDAFGESEREDEKAVDELDVSVGPENEDERKPE